MSLLSRVIRLESRVKTPTQAVHVVFHHDSESDEKVVSLLNAEKKDSEAMLIVVKFVEPSKL